MADPEQLRKAKIELGQRLAAHRKAAGLTQALLGPRVNYVRSTIANVEVGRQNVPREFWAACDRELGADGDLIGAFDDLSLIARATWISDPPAAVAGFVAPKVPIDERSIVAMAAHRARKFALVASIGTTPEVIDQLRDEVQRIAQQYPRRPLSEFAGDLADTQDAVFTLLERRQAPQQARQLYLLGGLTCGLLAKASHDLGEPRAALQQTRTAILCAEQADHDGLRGWLRGLQALVTYWAGRHSDSVRYAEAGMEYAQRTGGATTVWLASSAARAHAALGDAERAKQAIAAAEAAWEHLRPDDLDGFGGICTFHPARAQYYAADALAWLPEERPLAHAQAERAVAAYQDRQSPEWAFGDEAGAVAALAIARIASRDLDGAQTALQDVFTLPADQRIHGVVHSVRRVHQAVSAAGLTRDGRALVEQMEDFAHVPANALPR
ncbi:hypothetical protein Lfu02_00900 [Longispora fulva]|uniref:HTH cro/C1-type domain-containing protein n=1 Tax=Longispora fulva TaxID=619741 RepID=A0A8J7GDR9_9ACTN|nr:helix-turn-helix transcriptional regulator [Longispora fulva]MBG6136040.1 hypothetical protein [Longispora fulva]GIG55718.1 hypothetical protein Lfu02_00900 [Longispora fulva]